ncbi:MAG: hypothetical protein CMO30_24190 [Tistrella sp.]|uniref:Uncharacterized protein n=1 Tax=Tistrella mobilis TaxID=171437 RepID=A0A3B9ITN2_9PROT|nr:hypothetical protein [Tistrella sp.]HAE51242.1 hypothetical protein [Tistrella mobilis]
MILRPSASRLAVLAMLLPAGGCAPLLQPLVPPRYGLMAEWQSPVRIDWPELQRQPSRFVVQPYGIYDRAIADYGDLYGAVPRGQVRLQRLASESRSALLAPDAPEPEPETAAVAGTGTASGQSTVAGEEGAPTRPATVPVRAADPRLAGLDLSAPDEDGAPAAVDPAGSQAFSVVNGFLNGAGRNGGSRSSVPAAPPVDDGGGADRPDGPDGPPDPVTALEEALPLYFQRFAYRVGSGGSLDVALNDGPRARLDWVRAETANAHCVLFATSLPDQSLIDAAAEADARAAADEVAEADAVKTTPAPARGRRAPEPDAPPVVDTAIGEIDGDTGIGAVFAGIGRWFDSQAYETPETAGPPAPKAVPAEPADQAPAEAEAPAEEQGDPVGAFFSRLFGGDETAEPEAVPAPEPEAQPEQPAAKPAAGPQPQAAPRSEPVSAPAKPAPLPASLSSIRLDGHICVPLDEPLDQARIVDLLNRIRVK